MWHPVNQRKHSVCYGVACASSFARSRRTDSGLYATAKQSIWLDPGASWSPQHHVALLVMGAAMGRTLTHGVRQYLWLPYEALQHRAVATPAPLVLYALLSLIDVPVRDTPYAQHRLYRST